MNAPTHHAHHTAHLATAGTGRMPRAVHAVLADCTARDDRLGPRALQQHLDTLPGPTVHQRLGRLLGVLARDTTLTTGAADAFEAFLSRLTPGPGEHIWTTPHEDVAHLSALTALRDRTRCTLDVVPLRPDGDLDLDWMRTRIGPHVALVSVTHVSSACGTVNPVEEIGRILAPHRARYALDASHSAGLLPLDAARIGCHLLAADGWRFLRGPHDTGFAYTAPTAPAAPTAGGAPTAPAPAPAPAAAAALNAALAHHSAAPAHPAEDLLPRLRATLLGISGIELLPAGREQAPILAFRHREIPAARLRRALARRDVILCKTVAAQNPLHPAGQGGATAVRASLHPGNTVHDIDRLGQALREVLREERHTAAPAAPRLAAAAAGHGLDHPTPRPAHPVRRGHLTLHRTP
ncbi:aminotransferase class V-fold PLP-dependent enzyme [Streptomyces sp. NPDC058674]|uniref:aminotransferase class V-fold PLP-dependent enzyme n=1 Tax=Streptomyces sp. NPDC058674 TaxID=3346592 RepID=UPI0036588F97